MTRHIAPQHAGTTLVEALITFLVLSLGLLGVSSVQGQLRLAGDTGRERAEAVRLAEADLEQLRGYTRMAAGPGVPGRAFADIVDTDRLVDAHGSLVGNTEYRLHRRVQPSVAASAREVTVTVDWTDRAGEPQTVRLETIFAASDPALSGSLGIAPAAVVVNGPQGRAPAVPLEARNLGDGRSAWSVEVGSGTVTLLFDNATGAIVQRCQPAGGSAPASGSAGFAACTPLVAYMLSGVVRFATGSDIDRTEPVRRATVGLITQGSAAEAPDCGTTAVATAVGDHYLQYVCIVFPAVGGRWSGESRLLPAGWALGGAGASGLRVCREDGVPIEAGAPAGRLGRYVGVTGTLAQQNFRIIRADLACPTG